MLLNQCQDEFSKDTAALIQQIKVSIAQQIIHTLTEKVLNDDLS